MKSSAKLKAFIRSKETLSLRAYRDGGGVLTIGWGHTGPDVHEGDVIDMARAVELFDMDVTKAEIEINRLVTNKHITQGMYDCLVSMEFNTGGLEFLSKGKPRHSRLLVAVNEGRWCDAVEELVCWNIDNGEGVRGLLIRRLEEGLFFAGEKFPAEGVQ